MHWITSLQHPLVKHLVKLRSNKSYRYQNKTIVIEGIKLIREVCRQENTKAIVTTSEKLLPKALTSSKAILTTEEAIKKISGTKTPEGIVAEVTMPQPSSLEGKSSILALDGVNDPGNFGTLLRTALALGWEGCYILNNSCDPFNEKALRAARGATFHLPFTIGAWEGLHSLIQNNALHPLAADLTGSTPEAFSRTKRKLLVLSSEAHGLSKETKALCQKVCIPMQGGVESLNVAIAGGILMYILHS